MTPGRYDIKIYQRGTFRKRIKLPFNCTGHEVFAQVWSKRRVTKYIDFQVEWINRSEGLFEIVGDFGETRVMPRDGEWDLMVVYPNGDRIYWLEGLAVLDNGFTEPANA